MSAFRCSIPLFVMLALVCGMLLAPQAARAESCVAGSDAFEEPVKTWMAQGEWDAAYAYYQEKADAQPGMAEPYVQMARLAHTQNRFELSNRYLEEALEQPDADQAHLLTFQCHNYNSMKFWPQAVEACARALTVNPDYQDAYRERSRAYRALGQTDLAAWDARRAGEGDQALLSGGTQAMVLLTLLLPLGFLGLGLWGILRREITLVHIRWFLMPVLFLFAALAALMLVTLPRAGLGVSVWATPVLLLVMGGVVALIMRALRGYVLQGMDEDAIHQAIAAALASRQLTYTESLGVYQLDGRDVKIRVALQGGMGSGMLYLKGSPDAIRRVESDVVSAIRHSYRERNLPVNMRAYWLYAFLGAAILLVNGGIFWEVFNARP